MTDTTTAPEIADRIVLGMIASRSGDRGQVAFSALRDSLFPHLDGDAVRAAVGRLVAAGKIEITAADAYRFVTNPEFPALDCDIEAVIMAYAHGRGIGVTFTLVDLCAVPTVGHVASRRLTGALSRLVKLGQLDDTAAGWCIPVPTGPDRELIERVAGWFGTLDMHVSVAFPVIVGAFRGVPTHMLRIVLEYLATTGRVERVGHETYARADN